MPSKLEKAKIEHDKFLKKMGVHPKQLSDKKKVKIQQKLEFKFKPKQYKSLKDTVYGL